MSGNFTIGSNNEFGGSGNSYGHQNSFNTNNATNSHNTTKTNTNNINSQGGRGGNANSRGRGRGGARGGHGGGSSVTINQMSRSLLPNGTYTILNVRQNSSVMLPDSNDSSPVVAAPINKADIKQQWIVTTVGKYHTIKNFGTNNFASTGNRAGVDAHVEGRRPSQQFKVRVSRTPGQYTIITTDTRLFWSLPDNQTGTPVSLSPVATGRRGSWVFERVN
ncbi:hypothetical protein AMATHDRAFT_8212 [Amanita thiersii Skay4041]|uniref:Ricin B lectin domain-containing protein n=1 Tax=Amanita thiersii Skay4041 TaxID=703135 RepID=A0A2A9N9W8_9AGAR|nr:hypothetical protein AMATHDRAFT_8212 [Amanita thiersii Skay4041]